MNINYRVKIIHLFYLIFPIFFFSCEFQPSEIPETFVEEPSDDAPTLVVEVNPDMDTLKLATDVWTEFKLISPQTKVQWVKIYFDENVVYDFEYNSQSLPRFFIALGNYSIGMHEFTVQAFTSSNSGSIADKVGAEGYLYQVVWPVYINYNVQPLVNVLDVQYKNGAAEVKWEKYDYYGFEYYQLNKFSVTEGNSMTQKIIKPGHNYFFDRTYIEGEFASYSVALNGLYFSNYYFDYPIATPSIENLGNNSIRISWNKTENPDMLGYYYVTKKAPEGDTDEKLKIESPDITSADFGATGFGAAYEIQVRYVPKTFTGPYLNYNSSGGVNNYSLGYKMPAFSRGFKIGNSDLVLLYNSGNFYKYNTVNGIATDSLSVGDLADSQDITISESGDFFGYFLNDEFVLRETSTWNQVNHFKIPSYFNNSFAGRSMTISDNYQLAVVDIWDALIVYDCTTGNEVYRKVSENNESFFGAVFNKEGTKMMLLVYSNSGFDKKIRLADFDGKKLQYLGETETDNYDYKTRLAFDGDEIVILKNTSSYNYTAELRSTGDFSLLKELKFPDRFVPVALDVTSKQAILKYGYSGGYKYSYAVDINSGLLQKIVPIVGDVRFVMSGFVLNNGIVLNGTGRYLPVNDLKIQQ